MSELVQLNVNKRSYEILDFTPLPEGTRFRLLLVYPNVQRVKTPQVGLTMLSACAKKIGADCELFDVTGMDPGTELQGFEAKIRDFKPDLIGLSVRSFEWNLGLDMLKVCEKHNIQVVVGGPHVTSAAEDVIEEADLLVIGEGEGALLDLIRALATGQPYTDVPNVWCRVDGRVFKNDKRNLIPDLDVLPFPDWRAFADFHFTESAIIPETISSRLKTQLVGAIEGSRGCPFQCTYCSNERVMRDYKGLGTWRREKSPQRMVDELAALREEYGALDFVYWIDEIWLTDKQRLSDFRDLYKEVIHAPFSIMERPECIVEDKIEIMADAGLHLICIGLESGDHELRQKILKRKMTRETMVRAFTLPKKHGINVHAFTMVGLPDQDVKSMMHTWDFIREVMPHSAQFTIFQPLKGTILYDQAVETGMYNPSVGAGDYYRSSLLDQDCIDHETVKRYQRMFQRLAIKPGIWPVIKFRLARRYDWAYRLFVGDSGWYASEWRRFRSSSIKDKCGILFKKMRSRLCSADISHLSTSRPSLHRNRGPIPRPSAHSDQKACV